jgi:hypothetical protein
LDAQNSQGGLSPLSVLESIFIDLCDCYPHLRRSLKRDFETIESRFAKEGLGFLTIALPKVGKALERALETGKFSTPSGFKRSRGGALPDLFRGLLNLLFDENGTLVDEGKNSFAVQAIRQITLLVYKCNLPYPKDKEDAVVASFIENERYLESKVCHLTCSPDISSLLVRAREICDDVFRDFDPLDISPRHGPGAVASGERGDEKWKFSSLYSKLHATYPFYEYFVAGSWEHFCQREEEFLSLDQKFSGTAKVCLVPKDSRGPRLISMEPLEYQWIQQGIGRKIMKLLETNPRTRGVINFTLQSINQQLALKSSRTREFATIDMKDASDLVSTDLVKGIFSEDLYRFLDAARTTATRLPDGRVIGLRKFAPMGSALCFPIEAFVFWAISVAAVSLETGCSWQQVGRRIYVYGDDIIVPTEHVYHVMSSLEDVGLKVNSTKCFIHGYFRESCGVDAYRGIDVTIARMNHVWEDDDRSGTVLAGFVALANNLFEKGFFNGARNLRAAITERVGTIATGSNQSGGIVFNFDTFGGALLGYQDIVEDNRRRRVKSRWNRALQRREFLTPQIRTDKRATRCSGWHRLLRGLTLGEVLDPEREVVRNATYLVWSFVKTY